MAAEGKPLTRRMPSPMEMIVPRSVMRNPNA